MAIEPITVTPKTTSALDGIFLPSEVDFPSERQKVGERQKVSGISLGRNTMGRSKPKKPKEKDCRVVDDMMDHRLRL